MRSALRTAPAAYWASWADTLPMVRARNPDLARSMLERLEGSAEATECVTAAVEAQRRVKAAGYDQCPEWRAVWDGQRPEQTTEAEPGEWKHGWQYFAATHLEKQFRDGAVMTRRASSSNALLRSQSGRGSGAHLTTLPVDEARTLKPHHLRLILLRRLRLQLPLDVRRCKCGGLLDTLGDHRAACSTVGKLVQRAKPLEKAWARVCREAGARVLENQLVRDFNLEEDVADTDGRRLEVLADNLPLWSGVQLAVDATLVSPVKRDGVPQPKAAVEDGVCLAAARRRKETKYPELLRDRRCRLVVVAHEVGGRWSEEAWTFLTLLARVKADTAPAALRRSTEYCFLRRWAGMVAVAAQTAFAETLVGELSGKTPA